MATTITGKLNKSATQFAAGESTGFGLRLGVQYYDRETQSKQWTNFECVIFAKQPNQIQFYQNALVEGAIVEVSGQQLKIKTFDGQNGQSISIELLDAKIGYIHTPNQPVQQAPQQMQQQAPQQQFQQQFQQQAPSQQLQQQMQQVNQQQAQADFNGDVHF